MKKIPAGGRAQHSLTMAIGQLIIPASEPAETKPATEWAVAKAAVTKHHFF